MKVDKDLYFLLFSNCVPVKGYARSIICDLQLSKYYFIPNDLYDILLRSKKQKVGNFYEEYGIENVKVLDEYFEFLINNNVGILDNEPNVFP
ncbi:MAG: hypothetical protein WD512_10280, partial [Candidatus Paceibacterota bacterium]